MRQKYLILILIVGLAAPNLGAVRRVEDPIRDTQTDPILYKQKVEEEKDGKKGALLYNVEYNPDRDFLTAAPFVPDEKEPREEGYETDAVMDWWEEVPVSGGTQTEEADEASWTEEVKEKEAVSTAEPTPGDYWW